MKKRRSGFTLIELLVVMAIIALLAGMLLVGIQAAREAAKKQMCQGEINQVMLAVREYENIFGEFPPSGPRKDDGKLSTGSTMSVVAAFPTSGWTSNKHPLVACLTERRQIEGGNRTLEPLYAKSKTVNQGGKTWLADPYGQPYRYLEDGRRPPTGGTFPNSRVSTRFPIMWSAGKDGNEDPNNDQRDNNNNGKVDDQTELPNDVASWW